jgi:hypothetical protein
VLSAVQGLLETSMGGQLRNGDTLGLWTYNQQLYAGLFPLQQWSVQSQRTVLSRVLSFLQEQPYEHQGALAPVMPMLDRLIKQSPFITIILISDGAQKIHGTPFDAAINQTYNLWEKDQQKAHMPFLTILRAQGGRLVAYSVNAAPWPVEMPPLPKELLEAKAPEKKAAPPAPAPKPPPPIGPSLFVSGKKSPPAGISNSAAPFITNAPAVTSTNQSVTPAVAPQTNAIAPRSESSPGPGTTNAPGQAKIMSENAAPATPAAQISLARSANQVASAPPTPDIGRAVLLPLSNRSSIVAEPSALPAVPPSKPEQSQTVSATTSPNTNPSSILNPPSSTLSAPAAGQEPPISSAQYPVSGLRIWMIAGPALAVAALLVFVWLRRSRSSRHVSLITRSLDRERP